MVIPSLPPISPNLAVTVSDLKTLRQLAESGQLKTWQAGAILDVVVNRREGGLLMLDIGKSVIGLPVPANTSFKPGTALQLQVLALAPLQVQLRPTAPATSEPASSIAKALIATATTSNSQELLPIIRSPTPPVAGAELPTAAAPLTDSDPVEQAVRQLAAALRPLLNQSDPNKLTPIPARLAEWLARLSPLPSAEGEPAANPHQTTQAEWARLTTNLLSNWPNSQQASEPEQLEALLKQALFGEHTAAAQPPARAPSSSDWLGTLLRLLTAMPSAGAANTPTVYTPQTGLPTHLAAPLTLPNANADDALPLMSAPLPLLPDELVDELASVLGRHQQHWLNNLQSDARQQPLYAELLLRHGERLDPFQLSIREDHAQRDQDSDSGTDNENRHHVVRLRFDLSGLGVCQFLLALQADELQLHFYSEQADTVALFNEHIDTLASTLATDAIHLNAIQSHRVEQLPALQTSAESGFHAKA